MIVKAKMGILIAHWLGLSVLQASMSG